MRKQQCGNKSNSCVFFTVCSNTEVHGQTQEDAFRNQMLGEMYFCRLHIAEGEGRERRVGGRRKGRGRVFRHYKAFFFFQMKLKQ